MNETLIALAGLLIAWITYYRTFSTSEDIEHLKAQFKAAQQSSIEAMELMKQYADKHDCWDILDEGGMTYRAGYALIEKTCNDTLSDFALQNAIRRRPSKQVIQSYIGSVRKQFETYEHLRLKFRLLLDSQ